MHDSVTEELFQKKSVSALIWLIDAGRELEFSCDGRSCFLSKSGDTVSLWVDGQKQTFLSVEQSLQESKIGQSSLIAQWSDVKLEYLF